MNSQEFVNFPAEGWAIALIAVVMAFLMLRSSREQDSEEPSAPFVSFAAWLVIGLVLVAFLA